MHSPFFIIGMVGLFAGLYASRVIMERALRLLTDADKLKLIDGFTQLRMLTFIPLLLMVVLLASVLYVPHEKKAPAFLAVCVVFLGVIVAKQTYVNRRMRALSIADGYIRTAVRAQWLSRIGFLLFFGGMAATLFW